MDRARNAERISAKSGRIRSALLGLLLLGTLALAPLRPLRISGHSMEPTLRDGETCVLDLFYWRLTGLRRNDVVVVRHGREKWVKRLAGMPGDRLRIVARRDGWIVGIENLTAGSNLSRRPDAPGGLIEERVVGPDEIFVIGDNLNRSADSTNQEAGAFRRKDVLGVVRTFTLRRDFPFRGGP